MCRSAHHHHDRRGSQRARLEPHSPSPVSTPPGVRVSDAEREQVVALLRRHTGDGRLTLDEFEERVDEVLKARTGDDLRAALRELPPLPHEGRRGRGRHRRLVDRPAPTWLRPAAWLTALVVGISILVGHLVLWPLFFGFFLFGGCGQKHRRRGGERHDEPLTYV